MALIPKKTLGLQKIITVTDDVILGAEHEDSYILCDIAVGNKTMTVPKDTTHDFPIGTEIIVQMIGAGTMAIEYAVDVTFLSAQFGSWDVKLVQQGAQVTLKKIATNTWTIVGQLSKKCWDYIPVIWMEDGAVPPDAAALVTSGNGAFQAREFDHAQSEDLKLSWEVPEGIWADYGISFFVKYVITNATGPSNEAIAFKLSGYSVGDNDGIDGTLGGEEESAKTALTAAQYDLITSTESSLVVLTNLAEKETAFLKLYRDHDSVNDTYAQKVALVGLYISYYKKYDA